MARRRRVVWTEAAAEDLEQTVDYIARDSLRYAAALAREALSVARSLSGLSLRGRLVPEFARPDTREVFVGGYRLIYRVGPQRVAIIGFIHGSRDLLALWRREGRDVSDEE